ncbi:MAG: hypothetical protein OEY44_02265 [Candidatus Peregrinibacteria bacterium]|nr:hypothetical protein [Candidatus Peregrinibacteria bacterium]
MNSLNTSSSNRDHEEVDSGLTLSRAAIIFVLSSLAGYGTYAIQQGQFIHPESSNETDVPISGLNEKEIKKIKKAKNHLTVKGVQEFYRGRGQELDKGAAKNLLKGAKAHMNERKKLFEKGGFSEFFPGAHYPNLSWASMAKISPEVDVFIAESRRQLVPILDADDKPFRNPNGEIILVAEPYAELAQKANRKMYDEKKQELAFSYCFRDDLRQAIAWIGIHDFGPVAPAGASVHQTGFACDVNNAELAQDYLAEVGIIGGCYGTMYGTDFGHFSMGEMKERDMFSVAACKKTPPKLRKGQEKLGRGTRKAGNVIKKTGSSIHSGAKKLWRKIIK